MSQQPNWYVLAKRYPAVTLFVVLSALGGMLVSFSYRTALGYFSFAGFDSVEYWRLITPIFLLSTHLLARYMHLQTVVLIIWGT